MSTYALDFRKAAPGAGTKLADSTGTPHRNRFREASTPWTARSAGWKRVRAAPARDLQRALALAGGPALPPPQPPVHVDYVQRLFNRLFELHGDRSSATTALIGGLARFDGEPVMVIGQQKGRPPRRTSCAARMPGRGYRQALRLMKLAERFGGPVIRSSHPGRLSGNRRGGARPGGGDRVCLEEMAHQVPVISVVDREGGSGGALAIASATAS